MSSETGFQFWIGFFVIAIVVSAGGAPAAERVPGEYLVRYRQEPTRLFSAGLIGAPRDVHLITDYRRGRWLQIHVGPGGEARLLKGLRGHPDVVSVTPNFQLESYRESAEAPLRQWAVEQVHLREAWARAGNYGSRKVVVAVIDAGVDPRHPDLAPRLVPGYNFVDDNEDTSDVTGHGTHCAGIVGAHGGVEGASPDVSIMPIRFIESNGRGDMATAIKAIDYAALRHVDVVSASWGANMSEEEAGPLIEAIERAGAAGVAFVAAAGNNGDDNDEFETFPANANLANVISVTSTGAHDERSTFANFGAHAVHLAAPGQDVLSTLRDGKYGTKSGTSMAAPLVAGLIAFLKAQEPTLSAEQAGALLQQAGDKAFVINACHCRVNAAASVGILLEKTLFIYPSSARLTKGARRRFGARFGHPPYRFEVADSEVAEISEEGVLRALREGTTTVTVTDRDGHRSRTFDVQVTAAGAR